MKRLSIALLLTLILIVPSVLAASYTREQALSAISESKNILEELKDEPHVFIEDTLESANQAFERAEYAEMLSNKTLSGEMIEKARAALEGLDYKGFSYDDVIELTNQIEKRKKRTYFIKDSIRAFDIELNEAPEIYITEIKTKLEQIKSAYLEERFDDAELFITQTNNLINERKSAKITSNAIVSSGKYFVGKFWITIASIIVLSLVGLLFSWDSIEAYQLKNKLHKMNIEKKILHELMIEAQRLRYEKATISDYQYKVKMKTYKQRLNKIKAELPVLEKSLQTTKHNNRKI